jgi:hypothetical protein
VFGELGGSARASAILEVLAVDGIEGVHPVLPMRETTVGITPQQPNAAIGNSTRPCLRAVLHSVPRIVPARRNAVNYGLR